jgi:hypothetical protein
MNRADLTANHQTAMVADRYTQRALFIATAVKADHPSDNQ